MTVAQISSVAPDSPLSFLDLLMVSMSENPRIFRVQVLTPVSFNADYKVNPLRKQPRWLLRMLT